MKNEHHVSWGNAIWYNIIPASLGNMLGAFVLVVMLMDTIHKSASVEYRVGATVEGSAENNKQKVCGLEMRCCSSVDDAVSSICVHVASCNCVKFLITI